MREPSPMMRATEKEQAAADLYNFLLDVARALSRVEVALRGRSEGITIGRLNEEVQRRIDAERKRNEAALEGARSETDRDRAEREKAIDDAIQAAAEEARTAREEGRQAVTERESLGQRVTALEDEADPAQWAEEGNDDLIPSAKLPEIPSGASDWAQPGNTDPVPTAKLPARTGAFTAADESKLDGLAQADWDASSGGAEILNKPTLAPSDAEANVQSDWNATSGDALILNKPSIPTVPARAGAFTAADESKLDGIEAGAEVNVQPDWNASGGDAAILNKPTLAPSNAEENVQSDWDATSGDALILNKPVIPAAETGATIKTKLEGLSGAARLDASAIKNLPSGGGGVPMWIFDFGGVHNINLSVSTSWADVASASLADVYWGGLGASPVLEGTAYLSASGLTGEFRIVSGSWSSASVSVTGITPALFSRVIAVGSQGIYKLQYRTGPSSSPFAGMHIYGVRLRTGPLS